MKAIAVIYSGTYKSERVFETIEELKQKHGSPMQIRSEMLVGGIHCSLDNPPLPAMFVRAGKGTNSKKKEGSI